MDGIKNIALISSAGAGKTRALTRRFLQLLLDPADYPLESLYGITFTNEAAYEMKERIIRYLNLLIDRPADLKPDEEEIIDFFKELFGDIRERALRKKRQLFNNISELHISTFHSLFTSFLSGIPFAAGILPGFKIIDEVQEALLFEDVFDKFFDVALENKGVLTFIEKVTGESEAGIRLNVQKAYKSLRAWLNFLDELLKEEDVVKTRLENSEKEFINAIDQFIEFVRKNEPCAYTKKGQFNRHFAGFLTRLENFKVDREILRLKSPLLEFELIEKSYIQQFIKNLGARENEFINLLESLEDKVREYLRALSDYYLLIYLRPIGELHQFFQKEKQQQNILSFDDIEQYTLRALKNNPEPDYLYFKIGAEIRHLMIDEFQDTSYRQLDILDPIMNEITSVSPREKSLFYVGDPKQAIYRWRGGTPELFGYLMEKYEGKIELQNLQINHRSKKEIIDFVNEILDTDDRVESGKTGGWIRVCNLGTFDDRESGDARVREEVCRIIEKLNREYGYDYSDIAVLVRQNIFGSRLAQELVRNHIPCVSRSRAYILYDNDIRFIFNLLQFLDDPENDFALLQVLLAPIVNLKEETIRNLKSRKGSLFIGLCDLHPEWDITKKLRLLLSYVQLTNPYELINRCCREFNIAVSYSVATLFDLARDYIQEYGNNLSAFVEWFARAGEKIEIKELHAEGVKVLTVHKAKGLEFEVVILPEISWKPKIRENTQLLFSYKNRGAIPDRIYLRKYGGFFKELIEAERERLREDEMNLFYVALTRAKTGIYILGYEYNKRDPGLWIEKIVEKLGKREYSKGEITEVKKEKIREKRVYYESREEKPDYLKEERTLYSPTERGTEIIGSGRRKGMEFGTMVHSALSKVEWLDGLNLESEIGRIVAIIKNEYGYTQKVAQEIGKNLTPFLKKTLTDPALRAIFYKDGRDIFCRNELPIYFEDGKKDVAVQIDRLLIEPGRVTIVDYKTGSEKEEYRHQIEVYRKGVQKIYPEREVITRLVYLKGPDFSV